MPDAYIVLKEQPRAMELEKMAIIRTWISLKEEKL